MAELFGNIWPVSDTLPRGRESLLAGNDSTAWMQLTLLSAPVRVSSPSEKQ
jgi:hypothetical protein